MGGEIDRGIVLDELTYAVQGLTRCIYILENDAEFVGFQSCIAVGHVAMEHIIEIILLGDDDAIAFGMTLGLDEPDAFGHLLCIG